MMPMKSVSQEIQNENEILYCHCFDPSFYWIHLRLSSNPWTSWGLRSRTHLKQCQHTLETSIFLFLVVCCVVGWICLSKMLLCFAYLFDRWIRSWLNDLYGLVSCKLLPLQMALNFLSTVDVTEEKRQEAVFCRGDGFSLWLSERKRANMIFQLSLPSEFSS